MSEIAVQTVKVSKKFSKSIKYLMLYGMQDIASNVLGLEADTGKLRRTEFWALDDVSFELERGGSLGIIGPNGSGKTTLLKMLNGIFMPDKGKIEVRGKVGALIQVGAGFHPMLTGRENIYVNGAILGMGKKEIDKKFDSIVEFADIGDFLDSPVRHYSSGMFVRLGFAIAIHAEPDILLVDEILAVGDVNFRKKCAVKMKELEEKDVTIIFVTHDLGALRHICDRAICLRSGKVVHYGDIDGAISEYMASSAEVVGRPFVKQEGRKIKEVTVKDANDDSPGVLYTGGSYVFEILIETEEKLEDPVVGFSIYDGTGTTAVGVNTKRSGFNIPCIEGRKVITLELPFLDIVPGHYRVRAALYDSSMGMIDDLDGALFLRVNSNNYSTGYVFPEHKWGIE